MNRKNDVFITIKGKQYNIAGYEDPVYLKKVGDYINQKEKEITNGTERAIIGESERTVLLLLNIADDYLKLKQLQSATTGSFEGKSKQVSELKNQLVSLQAEMNVLNLERDGLKKENRDLQKRIDELEDENAKLKESK